MIIEGVLIIEDEYFTGRTLLDLAYEVETLGFGAYPSTYACGDPIVVVKSVHGEIGYFDVEEGEPCFYHEGDKPYITIQETLNCREIAAYTQRDLRAMAAMPIWSVHRNGEQKRAYINALLDDIEIDL